MFKLTWPFWPGRSIYDYLAAFERRLIRVEDALINDVAKKVNEMATKWDEAIVEIGETEGKVDQILAIVTDLRQQLEAANTDNNPKVQEVIDRMQALQDRMTAAGGTPAPEPVEPPAGEDTGAGGEPVGVGRGSKSRR